MSIQIIEGVCGKLEGESGNLSEVTQGFSGGTPAIIRLGLLDEKHFKNHKFAPIFSHNSELVVFI